ncbi:plastocyanin/azurin family copper-binding protein [Haladaptatus sp. NG-SE-30]
MDSELTRRQVVTTVGTTVVGVSIAGCMDGGGGGGDGDGGGDGGDGDGGGDGGNQSVDMTDQLVYDPEQLTISVGDTVVWENVGSVGHSVTAYEEKIPSDASYFASGGFDSEQDARDNYPQQGDIPGGESYEHTFEVEGTYEYFCIPHESAGMKGTIEVNEG